MNCKKCGNVLVPTDMVCGNCGEPVNNMTLNQMNNQVDSQSLSSNMSFQNNMQQPMEQSFSQNLNIVPNNMMNGQNMYAEQSLNQNNMQQPMEQNFSQNLNTVPNNMINGQNMYTEQPLNQNNMQQSEVKKKKNYLFIVLVIVLVLVIGVLGYFVVFKKILNKDDTKPISPATDESVVNVNTYSYKNFEFPIPNSYIATIDAELGSLNLVDNINKVAVAMLIYQYVTIDDYKESIEEVKNMLSAQGLNINSQSFEKILGVDWIILDCDLTVEGQKVQFLETFASLGKYHVLEVGIANFGSKGNETIFKELSNMINSTTYKGTTNFSSEDKKEDPTVSSNFKFYESVLEKSNY